MGIFYHTLKEAINLITSGNRVFIQGNAATPMVLLNALFAKAGQIKDIELISIGTCGTIPWERPEVRQHFRLNTLFVSENVRGWVNSGHSAYTPVFLSEIPALFERGILPVDVALVQVSPPDERGYCTLGTSVDVTVSAVKCARIVIAQVNQNMPRVFGDGVFHYSAFTALVDAPAALPEAVFEGKDHPVARRIAKNVASLIENRSTLQMGIGSVPDAVLQELTGHKDLGVHTEMFSDGLIPLLEKGVITNEFKKILPGKTVSSFIMGSQELYRFVNDNPSIQCLDVAFVNDSDVIRRNPRVVAINSAIEIDLTGQVCADSIGTYQYSGIGGQMDFMRGAALSEGGKPIIALPSVTGSGISRIVPTLREGAGVVTTRGHVHYVATENGVVNLHGKTLDQRARLLISISDPAHRETLEEAYYLRFRKLYRNPVMP